MKKNMNIYEQGFNNWALAGGPLEERDVCKEKKRKEPKKIFQNAEGEGKVLTAIHSIPFTFSFLPRI